MASVTVVGLIFVDIKGFPKNKYSPFERNLGNVKLIQGGVSRNVAENIGGAGTCVRFVSLCDDTSMSRDAVLRLKMSGIDTEYIKAVENGLGMWLVILDENGNVAGQISSPPDTSKLESLIDELGDKIASETGCIVAEFDLGESITEKILTSAEKYGKSVYTIVGNMSVIMKRPDLVKKLKCFVCNEAEIGRLIGENLTKATPGQMLERIEKLCNEESFPSLVITMGANGCVYYDPKTGDKGHTPSRATKIVDTSGAGDAFLSGVVMGLESGKSLKTAVDIGTDMAAHMLSVDESSSADMKLIADRYI